MVYIYLFGSLLSILLSVYTEVKLLHHTVILFLIFWRTAILCATEAAPFYIYISDGLEFHFLSKFCYFLELVVLIVFENNLYNEYKVVSYCVFDLYFPNLVISSIFSCIYRPFVNLIWWNSFQVVCSFLNWIVSFLLLFFFIYFGSLTSLPIFIDTFLKIE